MSTPPPPPGSENFPPDPAAPPPPPAYQPPPAYGTPPAPGYQPAYGAPGGGRVDASKKVPAGICGILLGALGIHKFVLGYTKEGLIMLLTTVFTLGIAAIVWGI